MGESKAMVRIAFLMALSAALFGADDRLAFDREYESLYARTDRFVDVEACTWPTAAC